MARPAQCLLFVAALSLAAPLSAADPVIHPRFNDLMTAVLYRDAFAVQELLEIGKYPDKPDSQGYTPLAVAIELGQSAIAETLLRAGADPDRRAHNGKTPRRIARERGDGAALALLERYGGTAAGASGAR